MAVGPAVSAPFAFRPAEEVECGFFGALEEMAIEARRLARSSHGMLAESVHGTRVLIKHLRALLWFAGPAFSAPTVERAKSHLREAAHLLAAQRELVVMRSSLELLSRKIAKAADRKTLLRLAHAQNSRSVVTAEVGQPLQQSTAIVLKTIKELSIEGRDNSDWPASSKRLAKAFRAAKKSGKKALRGDAPAQFHEWRKKAKRLLYQLQLTHGDPGECMAKTIDRVDRLQDQLGDYHDYVLAQDLLQKFLPNEISRRLVRHTVHILEKRKQRLREKVRKLARFLKV